jgi:hypothetical protein
MDELERRARENAAERDGSAWGYRVALEVDEAFRGRYRGETLATGGDYGDQRLFLFWDRDGAECYMRGHASLVGKIEAATPAIGDDVVVVRGADYQSSGGTGYAYGIAATTNDAPLPESPEFEPDEPSSSSEPEPAGVQAALDEDDDDEW